MVYTKDSSPMKSSPAKNMRPVVKPGIIRRVASLCAAVLLLLAGASSAVFADGSGETGDADAAADARSSDEVQISRSEVTSYVAASDEFNPDRNFAQVLKAEARRASDGSWTVSVRLDHNDEILADGSEHYADRWQVVDPRDNSVIAERVLWHHHINEMPFTRSQSGIEIDSELSYVIIRAACTHHGFEGRKVKLFLPGSGS